MTTRCPQCGNNFGPLDAMCPDCGVELERIRPAKAPEDMASAPYLRGSPYPEGADMASEPTTAVPLPGPAASSRPGEVSSVSRTTVSSGPKASATPIGRVFQYTARHPDGRVITGEMEAPSQAALVMELRNQGLWVSAVRERGGQRDNDAGNRKESVLRAVWNGVSLKAMAFFFRQIATLVRSGISVGESLRLMAEQTANKRLKNVAAEACIHCTHGGTMSQVLRRYPRIFPPPVIEMIAAGEESGNLDRFLEQIANYLERQYEVAARIKGALTYPVFMLFATIFLPNVPIWVMSGPAAYFGATLQWALGIILGVIGVVAIFRLLLTVPGFALGADEVKLALPVIGKVVRQYALGKFGRTLAMLFAAGVPLSHSLEIAAAACGNRYLAKKLAGAVPELQAGGMLSEAIARTRCFPPTALHVIATGERTGNIDLMVSKIAEFAEADANTAIDQGVQLIMPICIILLGVLVCIRAAQFYTGYFNDTLSAGNAGD